MSEKNIDMFTTRHSIKPKGEDVESKEYSGISEKGVELAKERAAEVMDILDNADEGAVMFIGGGSELLRTKSTARVYGDTIKEIVKEENIEDILVFTEGDIAGIKGYTKKIKWLKEQIENNPDKKVIVDIPLFVKGFEMGRWADESGDMSPYTKELLARNEYDELSALRDWFENKGVIGDLEGPKPEEVAKDHLRAIEKLKSFVEKYISDRQIIIGSVGHSWNLDALAVYLANDGEITVDGLEKIGGDMIGETQAITLSKTKDGFEMVYGDNIIPLDNIKK